MIVYSYDNTVSLEFGIMFWSLVIGHLCSFPAFPFPSLLLWNISIDDKQYVIIFFLFFYEEK